MEQVESLESSIKKLTRREHKHKKILFHHARDYGKKGLESFPEVSKNKIHSPKVGPSFVKNVGFYCQHCQVTGHYIRECPLPNIPLPTIPKNSTLYISLCCHQSPKMGRLCASRPSRYVSVINDNHLVSLMNFNAAKVD
jgi:hypothetical protein